MRQLLLPMFSEAMGLRSSEVCNAWSRFYTDAYDLFIIGIAKPMMAIVYCASQLSLDRSPEQVI